MLHAQAFRELITQHDDLRLQLYKTAEARLRQMQDATKAFRLRGLQQSQHPPALKAVGVAALVAVSPYSGSAGRGRGGCSVGGGSGAIAGNDTASGVTKHRRISTLKASLKKVATVATPKDTRRTAAFKAVQLAAAQAQAPSRLEQETAPRAPSMSTHAATSATTATATATATPGEGANQVIVFELDHASGSLCREL
jgi:hypothetical protein